MTLHLTTTFYRIVCDRLGCSGVVAHHPFLDDEDAEETPASMIRRQHPAVDEDGHDLCGECRARLVRGEIEVTWRKR